MRPTARRKKRSSRKRPAWTSRSRSLPGRRDDPHVDARPAGRSHPLDLAALDRAQEPRLEGRFELADLVDEERTPVRLLEHAAALRDGAGERAALVAEEGRLQQRRRHRRAVEDHERARRAGARLVQRLREHLLARPCLALDDDRNAALREARAQRIESAHLRALAQHPPERAGARGLRLRGRRRAREAQRGGPEAHDLPALQVDLGDAYAADERPVGRAEIDQAQAEVGDVELRVASRHLRIGEAHVARRALTHEQARGARRVEGEGVPLVGPLDHLEREGDHAIPDGRRRDRHGRRVLVLGRHC